jgi:hypothetical protein
MTQFRGGNIWASRPHRKIHRLAGTGKAMSQARERGVSWSLETNFIRRADRQTAKCLVVFEDLKIVLRRIFIWSVFKPQFPDSVFPSRLTHTPNSHFKEIKKTH